MYAQARVLPSAGRISPMAQEAKAFPALCKRMHRVTLDT